MNPLTSDDFLGQYVIACVDHGYHMSIHAKNWVPGSIFSNFTSCDLQRPPDDFWGQNGIAYVSCRYHKSMYATYKVSEGFF